MGLNLPNTFLFLARTEVVPLCKSSITKFSAKNNFSNSPPTSTLYILLLPKLNVVGVPGSLKSTVAVLPEILPKVPLISGEIFTKLSPIALIVGLSAN